jgi:hypothetical protein
MKICFYTSSIDHRGTCVALYDYALYNETLLNNTSVIVCNSRYISDDKAMKKFRNRFPVVKIGGLDDLLNIVCDAMYVIKYGKEDELFNSRIAYPYKLLVHCVFDMSEPHGDRYMAVSRALALKYNSTDYVPHMIGLPKSINNENMRDEMGISSTARVYGRYGGFDTFNIEFCKKAISRIVRKCKDIYFLLMNVIPFDSHEQIKFMDGITDYDEKNRFIQTCDAYIECGTLGHSFGLAIGEFAINDKTIIMYKGNVWNTAHYDIIGESGLYFSSEEEFESVILSGKRVSCAHKYVQYSPDNVMREFNEKFLS